MSAKILVKAVNSRARLRDLVERGRIGGALHRLVDGVFQAGFGLQRGLAVVFLAGRPRNIAPARDTRSARGRCCGPDRLPPRCCGRSRRRRNALEAEIGKTHADGGDRQHDGEAEHDFAAKSQGRELRSDRDWSPARCDNSTLPTSDPPDLFATRKGFGSRASQPRREAKAEWIKGRKCTYGYTFPASSPAAGPRPGWPADGRDRSLAGQRRPPGRGYGADRRRRRKRRISAGAAIPQRDEVPSCKVPCPSF